MRKLTKISIGFNLFAILFITLLIHKINVHELQNRAALVTSIWVLSFLTLEAGYFFADHSKSRGWTRASLWLLTIAIASMSVGKNFVITNEGVHLISEITKHQMWTLVSAIGGAILGMFTYFGIKDVGRAL